MRCPNGHEVSSGQSFCGTCGHRVPPPSPSVTTEGEAGSANQKRTDLHRLVARVNRLPLGAKVGLAVIVVALALALGLVAYHSHQRSTSYSDGFKDGGVMAAYDARYGVTVSDQGYLVCLDDWQTNRPGDEMNAFMSGCQAGFMAWRQH